MQGEGVGRSGRGTQGEGGAKASDIWSDAMEPTPVTSFTLCSLPRPAKGGLHFCLGPLSAHRGSSNSLMKGISSFGLWMYNRMRASEVNPVILCRVCPL